MLIQILNLIFRTGLIEVFLVLFVLVNVVTFLLYAINIRWRVNKWLLLFFTLACGGIGACLGMRFAKYEAKGRVVKIAALIGLIIALIPMIHITHALTLDRIVRYVEVEFRSANWPAELDGYRIAFMTDFHIITDESIGKVVAGLNERDVDLVLLGGDFSMGSTHYQGTIREIAQILTTDGIFGVEGNHDDYRRLFHAKEQYGIVPLDNSGAHIRQGFYLAGVRDMWNRSASIKDAIEGAYDSDFVLLLSHNPDLSMRQSTEGIDLILSGHTHGGQITFFGFPMYLLRGNITHYGTRFAYGFSSSADGVPVFVSRGIGVYYDIPRIFARPEVVIFSIFSE